MFMCKTDKAKLMHHLVDRRPDDELPKILDETIFIEDGNAMVHALKKLPSTFKQTIFKIADQLKHKRNLVFSTDSYLQSSIKSQERMRRGESQKLIINENTTMPASFPEFLRNPENKVQFFQLMLHVLSSEEAEEIWDDNFE